VKEKMVKEINLAVLGAGYWGRKVTEEYLHLSKMDNAFKLVQVCDLKEENLDYCKSNLHIDPEKLCSDYEAVLKSPDVDAVHICTPNETHYKVGLEALVQGKNVLLEKPMSLSAMDASKLNNAAGSRRLCLQVGHIYRFNNALRRVLELMIEHYFGKIYYLKLQWTTWMNSPLKRDIIFDLGPHPIDILHFLLRKWPVKVGCTAKSYRRPSLEEVANFYLDFGKKVTAQVELSWLQPGKVRELNIVGAVRSAKVDCLKQEIRIFENSKGTNFRMVVPGNNTIFDEVHHFVTSIRDESNHKNPGSVGEGNVAVLESLRKSLREERLVTVGLHR
jgi:UDP-N-acetylglucosamine 3-dehydrogenase